MVAGRPVMLTPRCWRCNRKLLEYDVRGTGTICVICPRCSAQNNVRVEPPN